MSHLNGAACPAEESGVIPRYFTSLSLSGANPDMPSESKSGTVWGLERKKEDFGCRRETSQHFSIRENGKSSRDLLLFGSCNLFLSCWEKW